METLMETLITAIARLLIVVFGCMALSGCGSLLTEDVVKKDQVILVVPDQLLEAPGTWTTLEHTQHEQ